ncbi:MAG TPA: hypothetical protein PKL08_13290 [Thermoanaerobaculaceae bacterium]|nr:hypothetical protein [Thermoanaerobaculaceae bacterium]
MRTPAGWRWAAAVVVAFATVACGGPASSRSPLTASRRELVVRRGDLVTRVLLTGEARAAHHEQLSVPRTAARAVQIRWIAEDGSCV